MVKEQFDLRYTFNPKTDRLGGGGFGTVYKVYDNVLNLYKALKVAEIKIIDGKEYSLLKEFENVKKIEAHTNIANYEAVYQYETKYGVIDHAIMQYYEDGSLKDLINKNVLSENEKVSIIIGIFKGLQQLHQANLIHRDLKPSNILIARDLTGGYIPKLSDFGLSKLVDIQHNEAFSNSFQGGTIDYTSPEQLMGLKLMLNSDLWAIGVIIFELFTGSKPFNAGDRSLSPELKRHSTLQRIFQGEMSEQISSCPEPYSYLIRQCLEIDPYKRIKSVKQILNFLENPALIPEVDVQIEWDDDETHIFKTQDTEDNEFPELLDRFLINIGLTPKKKETKQVVKDEGEIVAERIKAIQEKERQSKKKAEEANKIVLEADIMFSDEKYSEALSLYRKSQSIFFSESTESKISNIDSLLKKARLHFDNAKKAIDNSDWNNARIELEKGLSINPHNGDAKDLRIFVDDKINFLNAKQEQKQLIASGDSFFRSGDWKNALNSFLAALDIFPGDEQCKSRISEIREKIRAEEKSIEFKKIIDIADGLFEQKKWEEAISQYKKAQEIKPEDKHPAKRIKLAQEFIQRETSDKNEFQYLIREGENAYNNGDFATAIQCFEKALIIVPDQKTIKSVLKQAKDNLIQQQILSEYDELISKGDIAFNKNDFHGAINAYDKAAALMPEAKDPVIKLENSRKALELQEIEAKINRNLEEGKILYKQDKPEQALSAFKKALNLANGKHPVAASYVLEIENYIDKKNIETIVNQLVQKAETASKNGDYSQAISIYKELAEKYPSYSSANQRIEELKALAQKEELKNEENKKQKKILALISDCESDVQNNRLRSALKLVDSALLIDPQNEKARTLKQEIERLIKEERDSKKSWFFWISESRAGKLTMRVAAFLVLALTIGFIVTNLNPGKTESTTELIFERDGKFGFKINDSEIISPTFDSMYFDLEGALIGVRNDSVFRLHSSGNIDLIEAKSYIQPNLLSKELIDGITDLSELQSLKNEFRNDPLISYIDTRINIIISKQEEDEYRKIMNLTDIEVQMARIESYILEYPNGRYVRELNDILSEYNEKLAQDLSEADLFEKASSSKSIELLKSYLIRYPAGKFVRQAESIISDIERENDNNAWKVAEAEARKNNIIEPLDHYLKNYKLHRTRAQALKKEILDRNERIEREKQEQIHRDQWSSVEKNRDPAQVKRFIDENKNSPFIERANALYRELIEAAKPKELPVPLAVLNVEKSMVSAKGGSFILGCESSRDCDDDSSPPVNVSIKAVAIGKYEVTQKEYEDIMGFNPSYYKNCPQCPVENVSFFDALEYIRRLNELPGNPYKYRLPTEAEWEFFALGGKNTTYSGDDDIQKIAHYGTKTGGTSAVGTKQPNAFNLFDMTGNVAEWCQDYYYSDAYSRFKGRQALQPNKENTRVVRGGSFKDNSRQSRVKNRRGVPANLKVDWIGFRLVRELK